MTNMNSVIQSYFQKNRNKIRRDSLALLGDLIREKTVNPGKANLGDHPYLEISGEESKAVEILRKRFDDIGVEYDVYELVKGRANLIAKYGSGAKSLCVGCHMDVVPAGDREQWKTDPFEMVEIEGMVYGRGVLDNKGPAVSCVMAIELLKNLGIKLKGSLQLAAIASEEFREKGEPDPGLGFLMQNGYLKPTFAIIPDIGENMKKIDVAEKGRMVLKVTAIGKQAHGSTPELGVNAISNMARFIDRASKLQLSYQPHKILDKPSINLGIIRGGDAANIVAGSCEATFDIRYLPGQTAEGVLSEFKQCEEGIGDVRFEYEIMENSLPHEISPDNELVSAIQKNTQELFGYKPEPFGIGGGTFAKPFNLGGIKAVAFGPGDELAYHISNEYLDIDQMLDFTLLIACIAVDLLGAE